MSAAPTPGASMPADGRPVVAVGIDIGGTGTRFLAADPATRDIVARLTVPTPHAGGAEAVRDFLHDHIGRVAGARRPGAVGIGASGPIDAHGIIRNLDTLPAFSELPISDLLADLVTGPIVIENDAVCAALAEHAQGAARHSSRSLHVTLGTGIGVCLLDGATPFRRADGGHPEGGHLTVAIATAPCYCGRGSCWEQAASRTALQRAAAEVLGRAPSDPGTIADLAARGDQASRTVFRDYGRRVGSGLATLLTLYGPDVVVLGGSAARHLPLYRAGICDELASLGSWLPGTRLVATTLDDYAGAVGGACLAISAMS